MSLPAGAIAQLFAHLRPDEIRLVADHFHDDKPARQIAEHRGVCQKTVERAIAKTLRKLKDLGIARPRPVRTSARHVRNISPEMMRAL